MVTLLGICHAGCSLFLYTDLRLYLVSFTSNLVQHEYEMLVPFVGFVLYTPNPYFAVLSGRLTETIGNGCLSGVEIAHWEESEGYT